MPRPAPVTTATRPSNRSSLNIPALGAARRGARPPLVAPQGTCGADTRSGCHRRFEPEQLTEGAAEHRGAFVVGHTSEQRLDELRAATEGALGVRIVGAP